MASRMEQGERTEPPTALRLREARQQGHVPRSTDLTSVLVALGAIALLGLLGGPLLGQLVKMTGGLLAQADTPVTDVSNLTVGVWGPLAGVAGSLVLLAAGVIAVAVFANIVQIGVMVSGRAIRLDFARLSPTKGLGRMFSRRSLVRGGMAVAKIAAVGVVGFRTFREADLSSFGAAADAGEIVVLAAGLVFRLVMQVGFVLLALAVVDFLYQRWQYRQDLRMTRREVAAERRRAGIDPLLSGRRREVARVRARDVDRDQVQ